MADKRISELTALAGSSVADDDVLAIVDTSATQTKKIVVSELKAALDTSTGFVRITGDAMSGDLTVPNLITAGNVDGRDLSVDGAKLDGIEPGATADQTITAGSGLSGGGTGNVTISHADTSSQSSVNGSGRTYIQDITLDTYGHVTGISSATETVSNQTAAEILTAIKTVDGSGSGLDADLLDGQHADQLAPLGAVQMFATSTAPSGWLKANGAAISRSTYSNLFAAIGTTFGNGNGATTFNLPDLRGEFLRAWDDGRGVDSGRGFGSSQSDEIQSHNHSFGVFADFGTGYVTAPRAKIQSGASIGLTYTHSTGGNETRPRNIALLACIKY